MICSIFGHKNIYQKLDEPAIEELLKELITKRRVDTFYFCEQGKFDEPCYRFITKLKAQFPFVRRIFCIAFRGLNPKTFPLPFEKGAYNDILFVQAIFEGTETGIFYRNVDIIDKSDYVLFYASPFKNSNTYDAFKYALKEKKKMFNVAPCITKTRI